MASAWNQYSIPRYHPSMPPSLSICVYCSSSDRVDQHFFDAADELGRLIATRGHRLVYGGASVGLMGHMARSVKRHGGHITGVIPRHMGDIEFEFEGSDLLVRTPCIRTRKAEMEARSDAFIVLPGGIGTLEEAFEVLTLRLLDRHAKPIIFVNVNGFYDGLFTFLDHLHAQRFNRAATRSHYAVAATPALALDLLITK
jgi:uncharacterized protein (TIGR00730 family)